MMRHLFRALSAAVTIAALAASASAQPIIRTVVGGGPPPGAPAPAINLGVAGGMALDHDGNLLVPDGVSRVFSITPDGHATVIAGFGAAFTFSGDGGPATAAGLSFPEAVAVDAAGDIYIADAGNHRVRKIHNGIITTVAGGGAAIGDGGPATDAALASPVDLAFDAAGGLYIADPGQSRLRRVSGGIITTIAGTGTQGFSGDGGPATSAMLAGPNAVAFDLAGNILIADGGNCRIRRVSGGTITTIAGTGVCFPTGGDGGPATAAVMEPGHIRVDTAGNVFIVEVGNSTIREISGGIITTIAGNGTSPIPGNGNGGPATSAGLSAPVATLLDASGNLFIAEHNSGQVRKVTSGIIDVFAGGATNGYTSEGGPATGVDSQINAVAVDSAGALYFTDQVRVRKVVNGIVTTIAGDGSFGFAGDGGPPLAARFGRPAGIAVSAAGDIYIADTANNRIRKISGGIVTTIAGTGVAGQDGDGVATAHKINQPNAIAVAADGTVYFADNGNGRLRRIVGTTMQTVINFGTNTFTPTGVSIDSAGNIFVADWNSGLILENSGNGFQVVAGTPHGPNVGPDQDGMPANTVALLPWAVWGDGTGAFYIADLGDHNRVRFVNTSGIISTVAGTGTMGFSGDNGPAIAATLNSPRGVVGDGTGAFYVLDFSNRRIRKVFNAQTPTITWNNPADIVRGTPLDSTQLNATAAVAGNPVPGTFAYNPPAGTILNAGNGQTLSTTFTPDDAIAFRTANASVTINVLKATPTITWANPADIIQGVALGGTQLNATASFNGNPVAGTFTYTPSAGTVLAAGAGQMLHVDFSPADPANYNAASANVSINVRANHAPVANPQSLSVVIGNTLPITLTGTDADGDAITFALGTGPAHGTLSGTAPNLTYTPNAGYTGPDSFTFTVSDGLLTSVPTTIAIAVQLPAKPTITQKVNGQHPNPPVVATAGPMTLTLDISPSSYTAAVSWLWGLVVNGQILWVTPGGLSTTPAPLATAPPVAVTNAPLLNITVPPATTIGSVFIMLDGSGQVVAIDAIAASRP